MILNNIIIPLKHPYISPEVTFEEMEGESMLTNSLEGNVEVEDGNGNDDLDLAKQSIFFDSEEFDDTDNTIEW